MSRKKQVLVKNEKNRKIDESCEALIKNVQDVLDDERASETLELNIDVEILKLLIPAFINNQKEKSWNAFVKFYQSYEVEYPNETDEVIIALSVMKFIQEIDSITKVLEITK